MKLTLHHINLSTTNVGAMDDFYQDVLGPVSYTHLTLPTNREV